MRDLSRSIKYSPDEEQGLLNYKEARFPQPDPKEREFEEALRKTPYDKMTPEQKRATEDFVQGMLEKIGQSSKPFFSRHPLGEYMIPNGIKGIN